MKIHSDLSGKEVVDLTEYGKKPVTIDVPRRVYINFKHFGSIIIGERTQAWLPILGFMPWHGIWWWPIVYHPKKRKLGWLARNHPKLYGGKKDGS